MTDVALPKTGAMPAPVDTPPVGSPPPGPTPPAAALTPAPTPAIVDGHVTGKAASDAAPVGVDVAQRWSLGADVGRVTGRRADTSFSQVRINGTVSRTLAGDQNATHTAAVYQLGVGFGGDRDKKLGSLDLTGHVALRRAYAVTDGGTQVYAQGGAVANLMMISDERTKGNPYGTAGVGGRAEAGVALAYGPDVERRIQVAVYAEASTNRTEYGVTVKALSF